MTGKAPGGIIFHELEPEQLREGRSKLGLRDWGEDTI